MRPPSTIVLGWPTRLVSPLAFVGSPSDGPPNDCAPRSIVMLPRFAVGSHRRVIARAQGSAVRDVGERVSGSVGLGSAAGLTAGEQADRITRRDEKGGQKD